MLALHWVLRRFAIAPGERILIFLTLAILFIPFSGGINDYPLRHLWPFICLFVLGSMAGGVDRSAGVSGELPLAGIASLLLTLSLLIGPEIFLVCACTIPVFFFARVFLFGRAYALFGGGFTALLGATLLILSKSVFAGTTNQVSGDLNIPVYPSPLMLLYLFSCGTVLAGILLSFCAGRLTQGREVIQSRNLALALGVALMSFGALSRSDTGHILLYGLFVLVAAPAFLHGNARKTALVCFVVLVLAAMVLMAGIIYAPPLLRAVLASPHISEARFARIETFAASNHLVPEKIREWIERAKVARGEKNVLDGLIPTGFHEKILAPKALNEATEEALRNRGLYQYPYMWSSVDAMFQKQEYYQRLLKETDVCRWILFPDEILWPLPEDAARVKEQELARHLSLLAICMFPPASKRNPPAHNFLEDYRSYIFNHFSIASQTNGIVLMIHTEK